MSIKNQVEQIVRKCEQEHGHLFSGGRGLSCFLTVVYEEDGVRRSCRSYGNGVVVQEVSAEMEKVVPGFMYLDSRLD